MGLNEKGRKSCQAELHDMTSVTGRTIAYAAVQVCRLALATLFCS